MQGLVLNTLELLKKNRSSGILMLGLFLLSSCSSVPMKNSLEMDGATSSVAKKSQEAWEKQDHTATADFHFALGQAYSTEGKVDFAIEEFRAALVYDEKSAMLHTKLAAEYLRKGSTSLAIEECSRAIEIDPKSIDARLMLAGIHTINNEHDQAIEEYEEVLKNDPGNDEAAVFKTQSLVEKSRPDEALAFIRKFVKTTKDSAAAWYYSGKLEHLRGNTNGAVADFRKALEVRPGFVQASMALGMVLESVGKTDKAKEVYEDQLEAKYDLNVSGRLVALYLRNSQFEEALKTLEVMSVLDAQDLNTKMKIGLIQMQKKDWIGAQATFASILGKVPDSDKANYYLSAAFEELGKPEDAVSHLLKISPDSKLFEDANIHVAMFYKKSGNVAKAHETVSVAIMKAPETAGFYVLKASFHEDEKDFKKAENALADGLKLFPENEKMRYFYGAILDKQSKQDEAVAEMEKILKLNPEHADALNYIAYTWTSRGVRLTDAEEMLKRALKVKPQSPFILDSLGWNQFRLGKQGAALKYLEKAVNLKADEQTILEHLAEVYSSNQMPERAQAMRMKIRKLNPDVEETSIRAPASVEP